ncbi:septum formation family protein [Amycolatopsis cynarae]|uniref:Septum formation family protein n=1 Tax=Amycolatopsis cynarae TaxID=2995223 RepID=A0ABY7BCX5_9PSEU|nr:septum formation family protein [Amycolatopsis sp. HUAS 11-8]WAL68483.1 septum formation family protein [Amycolatopsis sp. HUAS 11-8]
MLRRVLARGAWGSLLVVVTLGGVALAAAGFLDSPPGLGPGPLLTKWEVGSCHRLEQPVETSWAFLTDTRPTVRCDTEHTTETYQVVRLDGEIAAAKERPSPVLLQKEGPPLCSGDVLNRYLGADEKDAVRELTTIAFFPTAEEWRDGERRMRCDVMTVPEGRLDPVAVSFPFKDAMKTAEGSRYRLCRLDGTEVRCDQPHNRELVNPWLLFGTDQIAKGREFMVGVAQQLCRKEVEAYLGAPLVARPDLEVVVEVPGDPSIRQDSRVGRCWVAPADPKATLDKSVRGYERGAGS